MLVAARLGLHHPFATLAFQHVRHGQSGARRTISLSLEMNGGIGFIPAEIHGCNRHIHSSEIASLSEILQHAIPDGVLALNVLLAANQQRYAEREGKGMDYNRPVHNPIVAQTFLLVF
jgi:hypothetical protein